MTTPHPKARKTAARAGAVGGRSRSPAKAAAARENLKAARAARIGSAAIAAMSRTALEMMASLERSNRGKARWLRRIANRGLTLTPAQREILAREAEKRSRRAAPPAPKPEHPPIEDSAPGVPVGREICHQCDNPCEPIGYAESSGAPFCSLECWDAFRAAEGFA